METDENYYANIDVQIQFNGPQQYLYVYDVDIIVDGDLLDNEAEWEITDNGDSIRTVDNDNKFSGYRIPKGSSAIFKVALSDINNTFARVYQTDAFIYQVKVGTDKGVVSDVLTNIQYATVVFNPIFYNVSVVHYQQDPSDVNSELYQIETLLDSMNGTNKIYLLYDPLTDRYDSSVSIDADEISNYTDILITAEWGVNSDVALEYQQFYDSGISMLFYGSIADLLTDAKYDNSTTFDISGVYHQVFDPADYPDVPNNYLTDPDVIFDGEYSFNVTPVQINLCTGNTGQSKTGYLIRR